MKLFLNNPGQQDSGEAKPSSLGLKFMMLILFAVIIGGFSGIFDQQGQEKPPGGGSILDGTPFDIASPFAEESDPVDAPDDPLSTAGGTAIAEKLEPFVEKPEVLAAAAARDRTGNVERFGRIQEEGVIYLAHKIRSDFIAGKAPEEPLVSTVKRDLVFDALLEKPHFYRGKPVELRANIIRSQKGRNALQLAALPSESNPLDTNRLYRSYIFDENKKFHLVYTLADQSKDLGHMEKVLLRGYFCRLYTAEVEIGGHTQKGTIPLLVASGYEKLVSAPPAGAGSSSALPVAIALVLGICCISGIVILLVNRRSQSTYDARRQAAREKGVSTKGSGDEAEAPPEDDSGGDKTQADAEDPDDEAVGEGEEPAEDDSKD